MARVYVVVPRECITEGAAALARRTRVTRLAQPARPVRVRAELILWFCVSPLACSASLPQGVSGPAADALARKMEFAVGAAAWAQTGAVRWFFVGRNRHLWDRAGNRSSVEFGDKRALLDLSTHRGRAWEGPVELQGDAARAVLDDAHAKWINDSFWLNPVVKSFDDGVTRRLVPDPELGSHQLLVEYSSGGRTPGDRYLWILDEDGTPRAWKMWVSVLPIKGAEASWERWVTLATGAKISTMHRTPVFDLELTEVAGAASMTALVPGSEPFEPLVACGDQPTLCTGF